jgi:hypothetical protein
MSEDLTPEGTTSVGPSNPIIVRQEEPRILNLQPICAPPHSQNPGRPVLPPAPVIAK